MSALVELVHFPYIKLEHKHTNGFDYLTCKMDPEVIKILLVGDEKCGKTTFLSYVV